AIRELAAGLARDDRYQTLLGVTGSGKTMTMAHVIAGFGRPTLVLSHNKTLAAQLYGELKSFFPKSAVEFFISYYDYYQPEAYVPQTDTYIAKDSSINDDIDRLRLRATSSLMEREDVVIVASVSAIYGLGDPELYRELLVTAGVGEQRGRHALRDRAPLHRAGRAVDPGGVEGSPRRAAGAEQAARGAAARVAQQLRHRHAARGGPLHRDRELLAAPDGAPAGRAARVSARLLPEGLSLHHRRVAPDPAAARGDVRGRPLPQADARRLRLPAPLGARHPPAAHRRVHDPRPAHPVRVRHPGGGGVAALGRRGGGADHPPHRPRGSRGGCAAGARPGGRPAPRDPPARAAPRARPGHDPAQAH